MNVELVRYSASEWYAYSEAAHKLVFKEVREPWLNRIDFALLARVSDRILGYVTCREVDAETVYWQYGGAMDECRGLSAVRGFHAFLRDMHRTYRRVITLVKNDNVGYLHLLMKSGFRVIGVRCFKGEILCEMHIEFEEK